MAKRKSLQTTSLIKIAKKNTFLGILIIVAIILGPAIKEIYLENSFRGLKDKEWQVCFTPSQSCRSLLLREINKANKSIYVQAYSFTDEAVYDALKAAQDRQVLVNILLDHSQKNCPLVLKNKAQSKPINLRMDNISGIAHNKVMIIDQKIVVTGSYNFTKAAYTRNAENLLIINDEKIANLYYTNWKDRESLNQ